LILIGALFPFTKIIGQANQSDSIFYQFAWKVCNRSTGDYCRWEDWE